MFSESIYLIDISFIGRVVRGLLKAIPCKSMKENIHTHEDFLSQDYMSRFRSYVVPIDTFSWGYKY